jgi:hypothetical protein
VHDKQVSTVAPPDPLPSRDAEAAAQRSADQLALALEDAGFDVGREFPMLRGGLGSDGSPVVEIGRITASVAARLTEWLSRAARSRCSDNEHWS